MTPKLQRISKCFFLEICYVMLIIIHYKTYYSDGSIKKMKMNDIPDVEM